MRLRTRLLLAIFLVVAVGLYFLMDWFIRDLRVRYLESVEENLVETANLLASQLENHSPALDPLAMPIDLGQSIRALRGRSVDAQIYQMRKTRIDLRVYLVDSAGMVLWDSNLPGDSGRDYSQWLDVSRTLSGNYGARATRIDPADPRTSSMFVAAPVFRNGRIVGAITVVKPSSTVEEFLHNARPKFLAAGLVAGLAALVAGWLLSLWLLVPIQRLSAHTQKVRDGQDPPLPDLGSSEIRELGQAFEEMRRALEGRKYVERYVHDLTHELKSPLTAVRAAAEILAENPPEPARSRFLQNLLSETDRQRRLVDRLLELASLEARAVQERMESIYVRQLLDDVCTANASEAERRGVKLSARSPMDLSIQGDRLLLQQAVGNFVGNAIDFSPEGASIEVVAVEGDALRIEVTDQGPGIPSWALEKIWDRFFSTPRPESGRKSTGLGLPFVREVARLHGGSASLANRPEGGCIARLELPARILR
ncbi:MAG: two-component system sensor histidine kinase CreC [Fibrobacterota bacterium]|nr:two-component system sensor histidine kinase CreC [Fibrobacterota bacterium]QQS06085.1 MAG: two-component system sensor histidine kinase CreC [Fibrobacterota bacterium]